MASRSEEGIKREIEEDRERGLIPTPELLEKFLSRPFIEIDPSMGLEILALIMRGNMTILPSEVQFAADSLFCESAYVIDLDDNKFEVFRGFNKQPLSAEERFVGFKHEGAYYPVKFLTRFDIDNLPTVEQFLALCLVED